MQLLDLKRLSPTRVTLIGFLILIIIGGFLLTLPISNNRPISIEDAYFTATSATCVVGLSTVNIVSQFSIFGQVIIMLLVQIGGLGFMVFITLFLLILGKKVTLFDRILISQSLSKNSLKGVVKLTAKIIRYTFVFELIGAIIISIRFIPTYGYSMGIFKSLFHSISSFCSAGFDLIENGSLEMYRNDLLINATVIILSIMGSLGFLVWENISQCYDRKKKEKYSIRKMIKSFSVHTKIVIVMTIFLTLVNTIGILIFEYNNENTIGNLPFSQKVLISLFQGASTRTTGISTIQGENLKDVSKVLMFSFMFIGGSPGSTAGGIKNVTLAVLILVLLSVIRKREYIQIYGRRIPNRTVYKAMAIFLMSIMIITVSTIILYFTEQGKDLNVSDFIFESISAYTTVGYSMGIMNSISYIGRVLLMFLMYIGRVITITMAISILVDKRSATNEILYPEEDVIVG